MVRGGAQESQTTLVRRGNPWAWRRRHTAADRLRAAAMDGQNEAANEVTRLLRQVLAGRRMPSSGLPKGFRRVESTDGAGARRAPLHFTGIAPPRAASIRR